ncbi:hypothetical protein Peternella1_10 [Winogradskyella phage Peternella_1]|uniref:Uncharacterized protein n=1 Tax=Winogradskyella phage Peternella_1 TaxID=2745699 RepID=A0A8E4ZL61_9CAUD|nr:hypothetical protein M1M32_gp10 [Winogradskyella phage Peternella_1]QQV91546.1 hypothetical protein Peternella1_10 [Winogradskyella phage Peternella_1]
MTIHIQQTKDNEVLVNSKLVQKDMNDNWVEKIELTTNERQAFYKHINSK